MALTVSSEGAGSCAGSVPSPAEISMEKPCIFCGKPAKPVMVEGRPIDLFPVCLADACVERWIREKERHIRSVSGGFKRA